MILHCQQMHRCYYLHGCSKKSTDDEKHGEVRYGVGEYDNTFKSMHLFKCTFKLNTS